jgi:hypothetical protein
LTKILDSNRRLFAHLQHRLWAVDPDSPWQRLHRGRLSDEALRMSREGIIQDTLAKFQLLCR